MYNQIPEIEVKFKPSSQKQGLKVSVKLTSSQAAYETLKTMYDSDTLEYYESSIVVFLNQANKAIGWVKLSQGGITGTVMDVRMIFGIALKCAATGLIISHNHPSGNLTPSNTDIRLTEQIKKAGEFLQITLLDHIIVTQDGYYSFADNGTL